MNTGMVKIPIQAQVRLLSPFYNISSNRPVELLRYIEILEECLGKKAEMNLLPLQPGDVPDTYADVDALIEDVNYQHS